LYILILGFVLKGGILTVICAIDSIGYALHVKAHAEQLWYCLVQTIPYGRETRVNMSTMRHLLQVFVVCCSLFLIMVQRLAQPLAPVFDYGCC
jgi:hypothetical protein